ncbi:MAG: hypothetical protein PHF00_01835 [Elusimicrobia bacterium]|nr:hypothetical protein [Elusimicrobiota bacterium]
MRLEEAGAMLEKSLVLMTKKRAGRVIADSSELFSVTEMGKPFHAFNGVYRTRLQGGREDERIDAVMAEFRSRSLPFRWYVFPSSQPADLAARLEARKPTLVIRNFGFAAMCETTASLEIPGLTVEPLDACNFMDYSMVVEDSFLEIGRPAVENIRALAREALRKPDPGYLILLARLGGVPAGFCALRILRDDARVAGFFCGAGVRPCLRRRGVMRGMIAERAKALIERKVPILMVYGSEKFSAPIFRKLGFREFHEMRIYEFERNS